jgi:2-methylcitrate dehydratase
MREHEVRVHSSASTPARAELLAWQLALVAVDDTTPDDDVVEMIINRVIDNTGVAVAALRRRPVANARAQALAHPHVGGATLMGVDPAKRVSCEWAAWANAAAVRELDFHDTFLAEDMNHPGDMISSIIAVGQQCGANGAQLLRGIAVAYEVSGALTTGIALHTHRIDHLPHIAAGMVAGIGAMLSLPVEVVYQALNHAVHVTVTTRQSRKGEISTWKAHAPAHASKIAVEAVDRAMRGDTSPAPVYEGDDSIIAWLLDGPDARYVVRLPEAGEPRRAILDTYTKAYSAEIQAQAWIDLAFRLRERLPDVAEIDEIVIRTSHHTHRIIGSGSGDPHKYDPDANRETLDHSLMYIFAVALEDGTWHHDASYRPARAKRPSTVALWHSIRTVEDEQWDAKYHHPDPMQRAFGGHVVVKLRDGSEIHDEIDVADAHPRGARPFARDDYVAKFSTLASEFATATERERFLATTLALPKLASGRLGELNIVVPSSLLIVDGLAPGLFERRGT